AHAQTPGGNGALVPTLERPASMTKPPPSFRLSGNQARRIADATPAARERFRRPAAATAVVSIAGPGRWEVDYYARGHNVLQVDVDGRNGRVLVVFTGFRAESYLARGHFGNL